jgi:branched-chain amino acid transport system substrate-binding protein
MLKTKKVFLAMMASLGLVAAACTSSPSSSGTITIGVLTDVTGAAASAAYTTPTGVKAGAAYAKAQGYNIKYDVADTQSSLTGVESAAQELVERDHVFAVVAVSALTFLVSSFLTQHGVPVVGAAEDSSEWLTTKNMFSAYGPTDTAKVSTFDGEFFKMLGVTNVGSLGYGISPTSSQAADGAAISASHSGLKVGYLNTNFTFGSTNVDPVALAMKGDGVNGVTASVDPNTGLLLIDALRQDGDAPTAALLPTGYGGDLTQAGPGALSSAQGVYFSSSFEPVEMHTAATIQLQKYLKDAGVTSDPTYAEYAGYASMVLLVDGLQAAGTHPTQASLIKGLSSLHNFTADGLLGSHPLNMANRTDSALNNCEYVTKLSGSKFVLVPGMDPLCGTLIPGATATS